MDIAVSIAVDLAVGKAVDIAEDIAVDFAMGIALDIAVDIARYAESIGRLVVVRKALESLWRCEKHWHPCGGVDLPSCVASHVTAIRLPFLAWDHWDVATALFSWG